MERLDSLGVDCDCRRMHDALIAIIKDKEYVVLK